MPPPPRGRSRGGLQLPVFPDLLLPRRAPRGALRRGALQSVPGKGKSDKGITSGPLKKRQFLPEHNAINTSPGKGKIYQITDESGYAPVRAGPAIYNG